MEQIQQALKSVTDRLEHKSLRAGDKYKGQQDRWADQSDNVSAFKSFSRFGAQLELEKVEIEEPE